MARFMCRVLAPLVILLTATGSADAWYLGKWGILPLFPGYHYRVAYWQSYAPPRYASNYQPAPQYSYVVPVCYPQYAQAIPQAPRSVWAQPMAAPPSQSTGEPPLKPPPSKAPTISESRSHGGNYTTLANPTEVCRVGFWNLAGRDVTLNIDGYAFVVQRDRAITFEVARRFVCQIDQQQAQNVNVPDGAKSHEIVIRQ